jgi:lysophospholipid acyltransferase (LPLAT)-like uncharacterized protein
VAIRHPVLRKIAGLMLSGLIRGLASSVSFRYRSLALEDVEPRQDNLQGPYLYSLWHEDLPILAAWYGGPHLCTLISEHADGQLISEAVRHMRMKTVAGSSTHGGIRAVRQMLRQPQHLHLVVTPDGPHGPRRQVKPGLVYLASRSGLPIVPLVVGYRRAWRLRSWDRLAIPRPGGKVFCLGGAPVHVPADIGKAELEMYRVQVQEAMDTVHELATLRAERRRGKPGLRGNLELSPG